MHQNVRYELQELERLMGSDPKSARLIPDLASAVQSEVDRIKQTLIDEVFHFEDERHLERYIQYHQQALIRLMDRSAIQVGAEVDNSFKCLLYPAFDELLSFIERHFTKYFDQDAKAPESYLALARKDSLTNMQRFKNALEAMHADDSLTSLILRILYKIADTSPGKITTYRKILYAKEAQKELSRVTDGRTIGDVNDELRQAMYYLNYNSIKVVTWHAHYISSLLDKNETRGEKIETLSLLLKKINQAQVKPGIAYNMHAPSLKNQLNEYISVELEYHERLQHLSSRQPGSSQDDLLSGFKLKFEASVSQLAYLLKILIEMKIIVNNNITQLINFMVRFAITRRSENISVGSLRSKFYNVETGTKESVRNMLLSMIHYIERN
jgi:hypothetical protein